MIDPNKPLYSLTVGEYIDLNRQILSEEASRSRNVGAEPNANGAELDICRIDGAVEITGLKPSTIYSKVCLRTIPFIKQGRFLRFSRTDLIEWIKEGKVATKLQDQRAFNQLSDQNIAKNKSKNRKSNF
jgi:excisionase family DNA binding protein